MVRLTKMALVAIFILFAYSGCSLMGGNSNSETEISDKSVVVEKVDKEDIRKVMQEEKILTLNSANQREKIFKAVGEGIAPLNTVSPAQAIALGKRAAMADAYRQLGAKLYGVKINAKDTVEDAALKNSRIESQVTALVKDAAVVKSEFKNGMYRVTMELKMNEARWQEIFAY